MRSSSNKINAQQWSEAEKILFRFFALFFVIQSLPIDGQFFTQLAAIPKHRLQYNDIFNLSYYSPRFFAGADSFANWAIVLLIAFLGAVVWSFLINLQKNTLR